MSNSLHPGDHADSPDQTTPVSPIDVLNSNAHRKSYNFAAQQNLREHSPPKTARFGEATTINTPGDSAGASVSDPSAMSQSQSGPALNAPNVSDVGFGYVADNNSSNYASFPQQPHTAVVNGLQPATPLKSALKTPGTARTANPLSPTFREEQILEIHEKDTEKENAKDVVCYA